MNKKILLLYMAMLFAIPVMSQTVQLVDVPDAKPGTVTVVMNMSGFATDAGSLTLYLEYDNDLLTYLDFSDPLVDGLWVTPQPGGNITIGWFDQNGQNINGDFVVLHFDYAGGIETSITFSESIESEITDVPGYDFNPTYTPATIFPADPVGKASLSQETAVAGTDVDIILVIEDDEGFDGEVYAITLKIGYDTGKLTFNGLGDNPLDLIPSEQDGVITLQYIYLTPLDEFPYEVELNFTYDGLGYAPVWFASGSVISGEEGVTLFTEFDDDDAGVYQLENLGKLSIAKVTSEGAEDVSLPDPPGGSVIEPDAVTVPITAEDLISINLGMVNLVIEYDDEKLTYTGPIEQPPWTIIHEPGQLNLTRISTGTGFTLDGTIFTMNFDYYGLSTDPDPLAEINFATGTLLQRTEPTFNYIAPELVDGFVNTGYELDVKVFLEGPYREASGEMDDLFQTLGYIPEDQPYNTAPWDYSGDESATVPAGIVDWLYIQIREATSPGDAVPATIQWEGAVFLNKQGQIVSLDGTTLPVAAFVPDDVNDLFIVIYHRTHLAVMSAVPMTVNGGILSYDFSSSINQVYAGTGSPALKDVDSGIFAMIAGDANPDGELGFDDISVISSQFPLAGYFPGDINMDGEIGFDDISMSAQNFGFTTHVPE